MYSLLSGFYKWYFEKPEYKVLILGLDGAGKTSFLEQVKELDGQKFMSRQKIPPTVGLNLARIEKRRAKFVFWDVGGQPVLRKIWEKYYSQCHAVVFVVDGSDESRLDEASQTLDRLYSAASPTELVDLPVLFLVTKCEEASFIGIDQVKSRLNLNSLNCTA